MDSIETIFAGNLEPDVYVLKPDSTWSSESLSELAEAEGFHWFPIDGLKIKSTKDFFREAKDVMNFPDYFGQNWNAVLDCMRDLSYWWRLGNGYILVYENFERFATNEPARFEICIEVMKAAVEFWQDTETPLYVLLAGDKSLVDNLPELG
jgi:RNAse (barnase) inhibitor barstar